MSVRVRIAGPTVVLAAVLVGTASLVAQQEPVSKSAEPTRELVGLLSARLESGMAFIAAKDPDKPSHYYGALYLESVPQLLVVAADYEPAVLMDERLAKRDYREAYTDLNSASKAGTKWFFEDLGANGLHAKREGGEPFDMYTAPDGTRVQFDGEWRKAKTSEKDYYDAFVAADARFTRAVQALLAEARKSR